MSEFEAYASLIVMVGLVLSMPFFFRVCYALGKRIGDKILNQRFTNVEVKQKSENE